MCAPVFGQGFWKLNVEVLQEKEFVEGLGAAYDGWVALKPMFVSVSEWWDWVKVRVKRYASQYQRRVTYLALFRLWLRSLRRIRIQFCYQFLGMILYPFLHPLRLLSRGRLRLLHGIQFWVLAPVLLWARGLCGFLGLGVGFPLVPWPLVLRLRQLGRPLHRFLRLLCHCGGSQELFPPGYDVGPDPDLSSLAEGVALLTSVDMDTPVSWGDSVPPVGEVGASWALPTGRWRGCGEAPMPVG
ncbi:hypothetical protein SKAU_G00387240 [Synaphobranchus kaupii]|uniref:Uncharacterized protein n=1 Tax=Synaphobranchus kaupii TaxID=118154 RepID=A0A9Q1EAS1_SYNKA|nr:hypothetical protein SKAU_G00387240 [Synaphobranchus kaupii]